MDPARGGVAQIGSPARVWLGLYACTSKLKIKTWDLHIPPARAAPVRQSAGPGNRVATVSSERSASACIAHQTQNDRPERYYRGMLAHAGEHRGRNPMNKASGVHARRECHNQFLKEPFGR